MTKFGKESPPELIGVREPSPFETICLGGDQVIVRVTAPALHPTPLLWIPVRGCCRHRGQVMMLPPACQSGERAAGQPAAAMRGRCVPQHCSTRPPGNWSGKESPRLCSRCDAGIPTASPTRWSRRTPSSGTSATPKSRPRNTTRRRRGDPELPAAPSARRPTRQSHLVDGQASGRAVHSSEDVNPPSRTNVVPLHHAARSLAKNTAAEATSSTVP